MTAELRALLALFLGAIGIGFAPICVRLIELNPVAIAFWRLALAVPLLVLMSRGLPPLPRGQLGWLWFTGFAFAGDLAVWHFSIAFTTVANATLLANLAPVFIALWTWLVLGRRLTAGYWLGLALALGGAAVLVGASARISPRALAGDALGVATAVFYAAYQLGIARLRQDWGTLPVMLFSTAASALLLLPVALLAGDFWPQSTRDWGLLLVLAVVSHIAGQGLIAYALAKLPTTFASVGLLLQPVAAALFAWALLGELIGPAQAAGAVVVMAGIAVCRSRGRVGPPRDGMAKAYLWQRGQK